MKLNITTDIKANSKGEAENIMTNALMHFAMDAGSSMGIGNGDTEHIRDDIYTVTATMEMDNGSNIKKAMQNMSNNPNILNSFAYITSETKQDVKTNNEPKPKMHYCKECDKQFFETEGALVNPNTGDEYFLCDECLENALDNGDVELCDMCGNHVSAFVENPVTHEENICPICGNTIWN